MPTTSSPKADQTEAFPEGPGTYVILLHLARLRRIPVGALGRHEFQSGYYLYVGSAFGPGGLRARLRHHTRISGRPHWHVDYLRSRAEFVEAWYVHGKTCGEHELAALLPRLPSVVPSLPHFGSSDCRCRTHLFYSRSRPLPASLARLKTDRLRDELSVWP